MKGVTHRVNGKIHIGYVESPPLRPCKAGSSTGEVWWLVGTEDSERELAEIYSHGI